MVTLTLGLLILGFLQGELIPLNLILIILICRAFLADDKANFYLAFILGLWISFLSNYHLGFLSLFYLVVVLAVQLMKKVEFFTHWTVVLSTTIVFLFFNQIITGLISGISIFSSINISLLIAESFFVLPIYVVMSFFEDRLTPRKDIRLKLGR